MAIPITDCNDINAIKESVCKQTNDLQEFLTNETSLTTNFGLTPLKKIVSDEYSTIVNAVEQDNDNTETNIQNFLNALVIPTEATYTYEEIDSKIDTSRNEAIVEARENDPIIDFSRVESYVKEDGTRWLKNDGTGTDGEMLSGQMLETTPSYYIRVSPIDSYTSGNSGTFLMSVVTTGVYGNRFTLGYAGIGNTYISPNGGLRVYTGTEYINFTAPVNDGEYHRLAFVFDNGVCSLYIDGILSESKTVSPFNFSIDYIGSNGTDDANGKIGNVSLIDSALTAEDIALDYAQPELLAGVSTNTIQSPFSFDTNDILCHFPLNEGTMGGGNVYDVKNSDLSGTELVTNGTFDTDTTGWSFVDSTGAVSSNSLVVSYSADTQWLDQEISLSSGKQYTLSFDVKWDSGSTRTDDNIRAYIGTALHGNQMLNGNITITETLTTYTFTFVATDNTAYLGFLTYLESGSYTIDNISIIQEAKYPITNYATTMWTNADNLPYGLQQTLLVKDDVSNFVTGISASGFVDTTDFSLPNAATPYNVLNATGSDGVLTNITSNGFTLTNTTQPTSSLYPRVRAEYDSGVESIVRSSGWYRISFDYDVDADLYLASLYVPEALSSAKGYLKTGSGHFSGLTYSATDSNVLDNEYIMEFYCHNTFNYNFVLNVSNIKIEKVEYSELPQINALSHGLIQLGDTTYENGVFEGCSVNIVANLSDASVRSSSLYLLFGEVGIYSIASNNAYTLYADGVNTAQSSNLQEVWSMLTISVDKDNVAKTYINGKFLKSAKVSIDDVALISKIGNYDIGYTSADHKIAELKGFRKALNQFEINELYNNIKTNAPSLALP